jgi:eukaryotic-like serine/threonine-protein kinase
MIGGYRIIQRLGAGGMGEVFLARAESAGGMARPCVIKTIHVRHDGDASARKRFLDEARVAIQLSHKNICGVTHVGEHDGGLFMAMDFVAGRDLRDLLRALFAKNRRMTPPLALYVLREMLDGLDYAHRAVDMATGQPLHLVHRDISPSNVMISIEGEVKLIDFGQALSTLKEERTAAGVVFGKAQYLSPEQARGEALDQRSDLYSLGVVATELLGGAPYYENVPREELMVHVQRGYRSPVLDTLDVDIRDMLLLALEPKRDMRTATAEQMRTRVERLLVKRQAVVGPSDLRRLLTEIFPGEIQRQRETLAEASGSFPKAPGSAAMVAPPQPDDTAPDDHGFSLTEAIPTSVARVLNKTQPIETSRAKARIAAGIGALFLAAIAVGLFVTRAPKPTPIIVAPPPPAAPAVVAPPPAVDAGAPVEEDELPIEPMSRDAKARARPKLKATADKLKFLKSCKQRCAPQVLDKYSRFATLSVDEARGLTAELDTCVKRCGG